MKKLIIAVLFVLMTSALFSDETPILSAEFRVQAGYMPIDKLDFNNGSGYTEPDFFTNLHVRLFLYDLIFVEGGMRCNFALGTGDANFTPYFMDYSLGCGLRIGGFEIGYRHDCYHPVLDFNTLNSPIVGGGYDEFYVSFKGTVKIF